MPQDDPDLAWQGALDLPGFQRGFFDLDDVDHDAADRASGEDEAAEAAPEDGALFAMDERWRTSPLDPDGNPALRLLQQKEVLAELHRRDAEAAKSATAAATLSISLKLTAAGHALLVASSIERELRRCERVAQWLLRDGIAKSDQRGEFLSRLSDNPLPASITRAGLQLVSAGYDEATFQVRMTEPGERYASLAAKPWTCLAFAAAGIADARYRIELSGSAIAVELPQTKMKVIAGGLRPGAVTVELSRGEGTPVITACID